MKPLLLDLFCCEGGAAKGYADAGFEVIGVDIVPQPRYPFEFVQGDALGVLEGFAQGYPLERRHLRAIHPIIAHGQIAAIHASPPCQAHTNAQKIRGNDHPDLIEPTRRLLAEIGLPYVIENVPGAPLHDPVELCGAMFGIETYRHRLFETNWELSAPQHPEHVARTTKMGRPPQPGEFMHIVGNFSGVERGREVMGMPWASRDGLREAIPPAYTEHIGRQLLEVVARGVDGALLSEIERSSAEAMILAAHQAYYEADPQGGYWQAMRAALAAADAHLPTVEMIARWYCEYEEICSSAFDESEPCHKHRSLCMSFATDLLAMFRGEVTGE